MALLLLLCAEPASALVLDLSTTELTDASATVVVARAVSCESHWTNPSGRTYSTKGTIVTDVRLAVYEVLKGRARPTATITVPGGSVGRASMPVEDAPHFAPGKMYVVFLAANGQVVSWREGQPHIVGGLVPGLQASLRDVKATVASRTGATARVLRPWSGVAPGSPVAAPSRVTSGAGAISRTTPVITGIDPSSAPAGTYLRPARNESRVTITGTGFGAARGVVKFFYQDEEPLIKAPITSWSGTKIVCDVPIGTIDHYPAAAGSGPVRVKTAAGATSAGRAFTVPYAYGGTDWEASRCRYRVNMTAAQESAVDAAARTWNRVGTQMQFENVGDCSTTPVGSGDTTHMPLDGDNEMCFDALPFPGVIAAAWPFAIGGRLLETDICFNTTGGFSWGNAAVNGGVMDIQTIAVHETGHWLNLRDLYGTGDADRVMYGRGDEGVVQRTLSAGDTAGIRWTYTGHGLDTVGPVGQAKSLTVERGKTARVKFCVNDPKPSIGVADATILIKDRTGKIVKAVKTVAFTRLWYPWSFRCRLAKGRYSIVVTAVDRLGHTSTKSVKGYLTVT